MNECKECDIRKYYAEHFDIHWTDARDCLVPCKAECNICLFGDYSADRFPCNECGRSDEDGPTKV